VNRSPSDDIECISPSAQRCELLHPRVASEQSDRHLEEWMIRACQAYTGRRRWKLVGVIGCSNWLLYESSFEGVACCLGSNEVRNSGFGASEHRSIEGKSRSGNTTEHPSTTYASINPYCCISYPNAVLLKKKVQKDRLRETERAVQRAILIWYASSAYICTRETDFSRMHCTGDDLATKASNDTNTRFRLLPPSMFTQVLLHTTGDLLPERCAPTDWSANHVSVAPK